MQVSSSSISSSLRTSDTVHYEFYVLSISLDFITLAPYLISLYSQFILKVVHSKGYSYYWDRPKGVLLSAFLL